jgi:hypothetical protein
MGKASKDDIVKVQSLGFFCRGRKDAIPVLCEPIGGFCGWEEEDAGRPDISAPLPI